MPTGYTANVQDGTITTLNEFVWACARGFGALVHMRDDGPEAPIRDRDLGTSYYEESLAKATADLDKYQSMTPNEALVAKADEDKEILKTWEEACQKKAIEKQRYEDMLVQVKAWEPPTEEHQGLKKFMIEQLEKSIDFDCGSAYYDNPPTVKNVNAWLTSKKETLRRSIDLFKESIKKERHRDENAKKWIRVLHESVPCPEKLKGF